MKHVEYSWKAPDGLSMFAQSWSPEGKPKAVVALVHGLGEHSGRYPLLVEKLPPPGTPSTRMTFAGTAEREGRASTPLLSKS